MPPITTDVIDRSKIGWKRDDFQEMDATTLRLLGSAIYSTALALSRKVNDELLAPISKWLDDPHWMSRFKVSEDRTPKWAAYKRRQRQWTKQQRYLAAERLRLYRQEIRRRRALRKEISTLTGRAHPKKAFDLQLPQRFFDPIISPFSPPAQLKAETEHEFRRVLSLSVSDFLPWKLLLISGLTEAKKFTELKAYDLQSTKRDKVCKLIHLLELEKQERLTLTQDEPFGDITIIPSQHQNKASITVRDRQGQDYDFNWLNLSDKQRDKIIADIRETKIITRHVKV
jgi:chromatin segregation and condensation protein Rec8/ScpA/Scc1 (kleisin family)